MPVLLIGFWFALVGLLMLGIVFSSALPRWLPLTTAQIYFAVGVLLGAVGLLRVDLVEHAAVLERASEIAIVVSLFGAGLRLRLPLRDLRWRPPVRLATLAMLLTVAGIAVAGVYGVGLSWGAALLLGALLAPTDPVLAGEVQVQHADDRDRFRVTLTGEAGLNDGAAFPFVMLGLGLLGLHELGPNGMRWLGVDVVWATVIGLGLGGLVGTFVPRAVLRLRVKTQEGGRLDDFVALGVLALAYGGALMLHAYGFLAAFAAGVAFRRVERLQSGRQPAAEAEADALKAAAAHTMAPTEEVRERVATSPEHAPSYLAAEALRFTDQLERLGELALVVVIGAAFYHAPIPSAAFWLAPLLFLLIRPLGVWVGLLGTSLAPYVRRRAAWFGMRGIGSLYYFAFAAVHGFTGAEADVVGGLMLGLVATSIFVHGVSARLALRPDA